MTAEPSRTAGGTYASLLRNAPFLKLLSAGVGSVFGGAAAQVCLIWLIFAATHSSIDIAYLGVVGSLSAIAFSLIGGTLVDRYDRRRLMILSDFARAAMTGVLVLVLVVYGFNLVAILVEEFVVSAFTVVFNPAEQSLIPALVPGQDLADANGLARSSRNAAGFVGASAGGALIVTLGALPGVAAMAGTFLLSGILISLIAPVRSFLPALSSGLRRGGRFLGDLREGFVWLYRSPGLFQLTISATFFNFFSTVFGTFLVFYATGLLHGSALVFGGLLAVNVAGNGLGALLVGRLGAVRYAGKAWVVPYGVVSAGFVILLAEFPSLPLALPLVFAIGLFSSFAGTAWLSVAQLLVPMEMQGRYFGIDGLGSWAIIPVGTILGGLLIASVGIGETYLLAGVGWLLAGLLFLIPRAMWRLGYPPATPAPSP
ncbi:MAG: MFS transporter [Thermoplasmata archaeon]|nr:MFS transporter [Thermoplasmata archaeon]